MHVSCTPPALILSQDQTLQRTDTNRTDRTNPVGQIIVSTRFHARQSAEAPCPVGPCGKSFHSSNVKVPAASGRPERARRRRRRNFGSVARSGVPVKTGCPGAGAEGLAPPRRLSRIAPRAWVWWHRGRRPPDRARALRGSGGTRSIAPMRGIGARACSPRARRALQRPPAGERA